MSRLTKRHQSPYRYDVVGSFLRPQSLKEARHQFQAGEITLEALKEVEDKAIIELIEQQEKAGLRAITDGEYRRSWWHLDFFWYLGGVKKTTPEVGYTFSGIATRNESAQLIGKIDGHDHPFVEHFKFVRDHITKSDAEPKQTIPAPAQFLRELFRNENIQTVWEHYKDLDALIADTAAAYQQVIRDLYAAGARVVQLDDCTWGSLVGEKSCSVFWDYERELGVDKLKEVYVTVNNKAIADLPDDLVIATHVCRGNYRSTWFSQGAYTEVATPLFDRENVNAYFLEYDSDRAGGFEPLAKVSDDKIVVLGLITSKTGELEDREDVIARINEASQYVPLDRLCLSTQCGFASTEEGNEITEAQQWAKIELVKSIAEEVWGA